MLRAFFIATILLVSLASPGLAQSAVISSSYAGIYQMSDSPDVWSVTVSFSKRTEKNGETDLDGTEHFINTRDHETYDSKVHAVINRKSLKFTMAELSKPNGSFTPMVYTGNISSDMQSIDASWSGGEEAAFLKLHATGKAGA